MSCSLQGPSHTDLDIPCQDASHVAVNDDTTHEILIACVADGAGSAKHGKEGSAIACRIVCEHITSYLKANQGVEGLQRDHVVRWCEHTRRELREKADRLGTHLRELATTLCVGILSEERCIFFQIGDGAIILRNNNVYGVVFWPQSGEYANTTNFLTADDYQNHLEFLATTGSFSDVALFTDGIERMALDFSKRTPFVPFFDPLLGALRTAETMQYHGEELRRFLQSDAMRSRSDDDKTLIVATRSAG
jgi:serine/threonine protein phosphatase PrpC